MKQVDDTKKSILVEEICTLKGKLKKKESENKRGYTEKEAAVYLAVSRSFLRQGRMNGIRKNRTPAPDFVRKGRNIRYLKEELDRWMETHQRIEIIEKVKPIEKITEKNPLAFC